MPKKITAVLCALLLAVLTGCGGGGSAQAGDAEYPSLNLKMSTTVGEQSNAAVMAMLYAEKVSEASGGQITITVYPSDQLSGGNMSKGVEMLQQGAIDCAFEPVDVMAVLDETMYALCVPWAFDDYDEAEANLLGSGGDYIKEKLGAQGLEVLGFIHNGFRQLTNSKQPVTAPEDLRAMKLRVPGGDVFVNFFNAFGADPVAMSFSELFTALQQGTVDGQENGFDLITANNFYEVQDYMTVWNYSYGAFALTFNKDAFDSFDDNTKRLLQEVAEEVCRTGNQNVVDNESGQRQLIVDSGTELIDLTPAQIDAFKAELDDYYAAMREKYGEEAWTAFGLG